MSLSILHESVTTLSLLYESWLHGYIQQIYNLVLWSLEIYGSIDHTQCKLQKFPDLSIW